MRNFKMGVRRLGASFAALLMICCLTAPALAASDEASMPSVPDFRSHSGSWYVWRSVDPYTYELIAAPIYLDSDNFLVSPSSHRSYSNTFNSFEYSVGDGSRSVFGCAIPSPISFFSSTASLLPSFPISLGDNPYSASFHFYPFAGQDVSNVYCYIAPVFGSLDRSLVSIGSDSSSFDSFDEAFFDSPFLAYPFALRSYSNTSSSGFYRVGGTPLFESYYYYSPLNLSSSYYFSSTSTLSPYPTGYTIPSSDCGVVFVKQPSQTYVTSASSFSVSVDGAFSLLVSKSLLSGVQPGDWISHGTMDKLQDQLVNDFDVDSDTLKNSKQSFDSWQNSNTIDTDVADTSLDIINGLMQNVGQFAFIVSLLCFGAVVLRVLIRKAVEG